MTAADSLPLPSLRWRLVWWTVFAVAFAVTEAALVGYVRRLLGMPHGLAYDTIWHQRGLSLDAFAFTREFSHQGLLSMELAREAGTMFLLLGAAMAGGGRTLRERWGVFLYTFAVWDLAYYLFLIPFTGFPHSLTDTDVYFLIPITWYGPVWFPVCVVMPLLTWLGVRAMQNRPLFFRSATPRRASSPLLLLTLAAVTAAALPARADDALAQIRQRGEVAIFSDATYPPFESMQGDAVVGFDADIAREIGKELGVKVRQQNAAWDGIFPALAAGKCDLIMSGVTITDERKKGNSFTRPYFLSGQVIVRRKGDTRFARPEDLSAPGVIVAVQQETTGQFAAEKRGVPKDRLHRFDALPDACLDLRNKKSDAVVGDLPALAALVQKGFPELEIAPAGLLSKENLGIVARKDARDLVAAVNIALDHIMVDGRYAAIYNRWIGGDPADTQLIAGLAGVADQGTTIPPEIADQVANKGKAAPTTSAASPSGSALAIRPGILAQVFPQLLRGARLTITLTLLTLCLGIPLGLLVALGRLSAFVPLRWAASVYVEAIRGTPLLMQIFVIYFVMPSLHIELTAFQSGLAALTLNSAAYVAEIFRAGIESIDTGQREAARALGMSNAQTMQYVILPQTIRRVLPPLTNEAVALLKDSSLVSVVALAELMRVGKELATNTGAPTTVYLAVALLYLAMTLPLTFLVRALEVRWQPISRPRQRLKRMARTTPEQAT